MTAQPETSAGPELDYMPCLAYGDCPNGPETHPFIAPLDAGITACTVQPWERGGDPVRVEDTAAARMTAMLVLQAGGDADVTLAEYNAGAHLWTTRVPGGLRLHAEPWGAGVTVP